MIENARAVPLKPVQHANGKRSLEQTRGRLLRLHGRRYLFALFSAACFACTALVIFSLSFPASWGPLGSLFAALGWSWGALGRSWAALGWLLIAIGPLLAALGAILEQHPKIIFKPMPKMMDFDSPKPPQMAPNSD